MIYTCTVNPSLDYYLTFDSNIQGGTINRALKEDYDAGGKGVNVSIVLNNLMIPNVALGFLGGFTKDYYLSFIKKYSYIEPLFTSIKDNTRINLKIFANEAIDINAKGPHISEEEFDRFRKRLYRIYPNDIFVLSGNVQTEIFDKMVDLICDLSSNGIKIVLDTSVELVENCLKYRPYLVRLNEDDLLKFGKNKDKAETMKYLVANGINNLIVPVGEFGSIFACSEGLYQCLHDEKDKANTAGMADSMVAGYLYAIQKGASPIEAFRYANAASAATVLTGNLATREATEENFNRLNVGGFKG